MRVLTARLRPLRLCADIVASLEILALMESQNAPRALICSR